MDIRKEFERFCSDNGKIPKAIERDAAGQYKLMSTALAWKWFQRGWEASARDGFVVVPINPTDEMLIAGSRSGFSSRVWRYMVETAIDEK